MIRIRRMSVGLFVFAGLTVMGLALSDYANGQDKADKGKAEDAPKLVPGGRMDWNKTKIAFEMSGKDWPSIFQWLADKSGMPFSSPYKVSGTFTFTPPQGAKYTLIEIYDIINEVLQTQQKFTLLRSEVTLSLVPADEPISGRLVPRINIDELKERGRTEIVEISFRLRSGLDARECAADVKRQLGPFAVVSPLEFSNKLVVQGDVATLRKVLPEYAAELDISKGVDSEHTLVHKCKYIRADKAEAVISKALGQQTIFVVGKGGNPGGGAPPDPGGKGGGGPVKQVKPHTVTSDRNTNTVIVTGPQTKLDEAKAILASIDKGTGPGLLPTTPHQFLNHELPLGGADAMAKMLGEIYRTDESIRIQVASPSRLFVWADPQTHFEIKGIVTVKAPEILVETVAIPLLRLDAAKFVVTLKDMFPNSKSGSPFIDADTDQNSIRLRGTAEEIKDVRVVIRILDGSIGAEGAHTRMINLEKGSGATVSEAVYLLLGQLRPDINLKLLLPGQLDDLKDLFNQPKPPAKVDTKPKSEKLLPPKSDVDDKPFQKKPIARLTPDKLREVIYANDLTPSGYVLYDSQEKKPAAKDIEKDEKELKKKKGSITISGFGNRIIITGDDPEALDLAHQMIRILVNTEAGPGDFEVLNLKWASAVEVAKILDEAFNGPKTQGGGGGGRQGGGGGGLQLPGIGGIMGSMLGIGGGQQGRPENIRVVADPSTNALLIRAKPIDMLTIRRLIAKQLDVRNVDSASLARTFIIGPLKNATAPNVAEILDRVYRDAMASRNSSSVAQNSPGFSFMAQQRSVEPVGGGAAASLTIGVDNTTNSIVVHCSTTMYDDVKKLVDDLDLVAGSNKQVVKVISVKDIDPAIVQQAVDAISGKTSVARQGQGQGGFGQANNAPGAFGTSGRTFGNQGGNFGGNQTFGGNQGFGGGGVPIFMQPGGGGFQGIAPGITPGGGGGGPRIGGPGGGTGTKGGGATRPGGRSLDRGPDFFVSRVMDDPSVSVLFDPSEEQDDFDFRPNEQFIKRPVYSANPLLLTLQEEKKGELLPLPLGKDDLSAPRLPVQIEPIPSLGIVIVRAQNEADLLAVLRILELVRKSSEPSLVEIELVPVRFGDPTQIVDQLNRLYGRVNLGTTFTEISGGAPRPGGGAGPQVVQQQVGSVTQPTNIVLLPQQRLGAILVAASRVRMPDIKKQIQMFDNHYSDVAGLKTYSLKRAAAARVATSLNTFYATRFANEGPLTNQIRITYDDGTNSVIVQASPADLKEIDRIIAHIDTAPNGVNADIRIIPLRNAVASDLASLLQVSIANGVLTINTVQTTVVAQPGAAPGGGAANLQAFGQVTPVTKEFNLRFRPSTSKDGKMFETRILEDIRIYADIRTNSLVITAPSESMQLILALIGDLDVQPNARSEINIFTLKKSDATQLAIMLQQLFVGSGGVGAKATAGGAAPGGGAVGAPKPLSFTLQTTTPEGAPIIDLRVTVDERTNSLIVAGSQNDLRVVETIIARIEDAAVQERRNEAVKLRNSQAADIANAVTLYVTNYQKIYSTYGQATNSLGLVRDVIVVAEPISNSLLISATPKIFDEIINLIAKLDTAPPQVVIQVLIAEVTMNGSEEFGIEIGLQNPLQFMRGILPDSPAVRYATAANGGLPQSAAQAAAVTNTSSPAVQSLTNLGVGRVSPTNNIAGYVFSLNTDTVSVLVRALKIQGRINVLSRPQVMTLDNQTAVINVGQEIPIVESTTITATGLATNSIVRRNVGVIMQVTPRITPDGRVLMRIVPEVSSVGTPINLGNGQVGTTLNIQHLETTIAAADGETVLLGGLISKRDEKNENKVPWLGDLPIIGAGFRYRTYNKTKTELIIIMTPHIIRDRGDADRILSEESRRIDWSLYDVNRIHGHGFGTCPPMMPEGSPRTQPFRIYPQGTPGSAEFAPQAAAPGQQMPAPAQYAPQPIEAEPAKAPLLRGGLIQSMRNKRSVETTVVEPQPMAQPLPQVNSAGNPLNSSILTLPPANNFSGPNNR